MHVAEVTTLAPAGSAAPPSPPRVVSASGLMLSAVALGCALQVNFGQFHPLALLWLTVTLAGCLLSFWRPASPLFTQLLDGKVAWVLGAGLAVQIALLLSRSPGATGALGPGWDLTPFRVMILAAGLFAAGAIWGRGVFGRACFWGMLLVHAGMGLWVLRAAPDPGVDVLLFQRESCDALVQGRNPYAITFERKSPSRFYAPEVIANGRLMFGFPYPPLSLMLALPGYVLGDVRYAQWLAMTLAGALVAGARPGRFSTAAATVLLFTPRGFFVLEAGWTEPFAVLLLAAAMYLAVRNRRGTLLAVVTGLLLAMKQYLVLALLVAPLLPQRPGRGKALAWAAGAALAVTLPLALWDLPAFVHSAIVLQFRQPFRDDSLSYLAAIARLTDWRPPSWVVLGALAPAIAFCYKKCPRTPAGAAAALAFICLVFFAFNKQAFCNYYYFVIGALCCAAGAASAGPVAPVPVISESCDSILR